MLTSRSAYLTQNHVWKFFLFIKGVCLCTGLDVCVCILQQPVFSLCV